MPPTEAIRARARNCEKLAKKISIQKVADLRNDVLAVELSRGLFVLGGEVLAVAAPRRIELNQRQIVALHVRVKGRGRKGLDQRRIRRRLRLLRNCQ